MHLNKPKSKIWMVWAGTACVLTVASVAWATLAQTREQKPTASTNSIALTERQAPVVSQVKAQVGPPIELAPASLASQLTKFKGERGVVLIVHPNKSLSATQIKQGLERDATIAPLFDQLALGLMAPSEQAGADEEDLKLPVFHLPDAKSTSARALKFEPSQTGVVAVDYAGWLRHREVVAVPDAKAMQAAMTRAVAALPLRENGPFGVQVGEAAPNFVMRDAKGTMRRLSDLRGKKQLLLTFFPRCFTFHCGQQLASLRDNYGKLQAADVEVWGVSTDVADGEKGQRAYGEYLKLPFALLPDDGRNLSLLMGAVQSPTQMATRMSILIDKEGIVRKIDKQINPKTHGADVLKLLVKGTDKLKSK